MIARLCRLGAPDDGIEQIVTHQVNRTVPVPAYVCECDANSPSNLASTEKPLMSRSSAPADVSAEFFAGVAPLTMKLAPGSASNPRMSDGLVTQSCAHAILPRKASTALQLSNICLSKRAPSSLLVSVALRA